MAKKVTEDDIISRLQGRPLTMVEYAGAVLGKSLFRCHVCGHEWRASADNVTRGKGCPQCKLANSRVSRSDAEKRANRIGFTLLKYTKASEPVRAKCLAPECGHETSASNFQHLENLQGCRKCWERERGLLPEQVHETLNARGITLLHHAGNTSDLSRFQCQKDGHVWETNLGDVLRGQGCRKCAGLLTLTKEVVEERLQGRNITVLDYAGSGSSPHTRFRCEIDGHEWTTTANSVLAGQGCARCAGMFTYTQEELVAKMGAMKVDILIYSGYVSRQNRFRCQVDGYEWTGSIREALQNQAPCARCGGREPYTTNLMIERLKDRPVRLLQFSEGAMSRSTFKCTVPSCGHVWKSSNASVSLGTGCPKCAGVLKLTEKEARLKASTRPELTLVTYAGTSEDPNTLWHCNKCDGEWKAPVGRVFGSWGSGCPHCAETGFRPGKPATFYAYKITNALGYDYLGFGITGKLSRRDYFHQRAFSYAGASGQIIWSVDHPVGQAVRDVESEVKATFPVASSGVEGFIDEAMPYSEENERRLRTLVESRLLAVRTMSI